jgi:hypothetical protein
VDIVVTGDRSVSAYGGLSPATLTPSGGSGATAGSGGSAEDHISVSSATSRIQTTLSTLSASQAARVSRLKAFYGGHEANSSRIAQALMSRAAQGETNKI